MGVQRRHVRRTEVASKILPCELPHRVDPPYFPLGRDLKLIFGQPGRQRLNAIVGLLQLGLVVRVLALIRLNLLLCFEFELLIVGCQFLDAHLHLRLVFLPDSQLVLVLHLELLHLCRLLLHALFELFLLFLEDHGFRFGPLEFLLDGGVLAIDLLHV